MKHQLPKIRWTRRTNGSPLHFQNWLAENELRAMAHGSEDASPDTQPGDFRDINEFSAAFDPNPSVGEIRLLSAEFSSEPERPVYVAILRHWEGEGMVTAVFSSYSSPALSTELQFPARPHSLRTLSLWHHYVLPPEVLAKSWLVDTLSVPELSEAWQVFRHAFTDEPLPATLAERVGTKITSESDPRIAYQHAELALLQPLALAAEVAEEGNEETEGDPSAERASHSRVFFNWLAGLSDRLAEILKPAPLLAAADLTQPHPVFPAPLVFEIENVPFFVRFYPQPQDELLTVLITDERLEVSKVYDGYYLTFGNIDSEKLVIQSGKASLKISSDKISGEISFHTPDGRPVRTRPVE